MSDLNNIRLSFNQKIIAVNSKDSLQILKTEFFGKNGLITSQFKNLGTISQDKRKEFASDLNNLKNDLNDQLEKKLLDLETAEINEKLKGERVDVTLPIRSTRAGKIHPVSQVIDEIASIFSEIGFSLAEGPDVETEYNNFTALNTPESHPARDMHDTFYLEENKKILLRTHTSPVQIRTMLKDKPPFKIIAPGRTYRSDSDQTHAPMFHQVEGLAIDKSLSMANLKWVLEEFVKAYFEVDDVELRFRASHFPFTEPSAEVDIRCSWDKGQLKVGEGDDWLEILGSGMVHPKVLQAGGIDPELWQGFAFGMGIDRIAMLKYGVPDLRAFFDSDLRWLRHYGFNSLEQPNLHSGLSR